MRKYILAMIMILLLALVGCGQQTAVSSDSEVSAESSELVSIVSKPPESETYSSDLSNTNSEPREVSGEDKSIPHTDGTYGLPQSDVIPDEIWDYSQKMYSFEDYCNAHMNEDVYGGYTTEGDIVILYYLDLEQVKSVAEQYEPDWNGHSHKYVEDPVQVEYRQAKYSMTFLNQVKQELCEEMTQQGIENPESGLHIYNNQLTVSLFEEEIPKMEKFLKTYKLKDCIELRNASARLIPNT